MPLVAYKNIPSFTRLQQDGHLILSEDRALRQDYRGLHIGLLNMMPDAALEVTERQFFRLIGRSDRIMQFYMHPFSIPGIERSSEAQSYIDQYYESFEDIKKIGLDALIITGANVASADLKESGFFEPFQDVLDWAFKNVTSVLCSCISTHAAMLALYNESRTPLTQKLFGVYEHRVNDALKPLTRGINTCFHAPHSRHNMIAREQFINNNMLVLAESQDAGVHLASSADGLRLVCFQGHPEYDRVSLLKEFKRDMNGYLNKALDTRPALPQNHINAAYADKFLALVDRIYQTGDLSLFNEDLIQQYIDNTWQDTARSIIQNWVGAVYQVTGFDRHQPFMDKIDPENPLATVLI
ncbi:MAG: homoserine O-succinyltransferase MetA [Alphaproteobacteria bacterium]